MYKFQIQVIKVFLIVTILFACAPLGEPNQTNSCLQPITTFSYIYRKTNENINNPEPTLPNKPWILQSEAPVSVSNPQRNKESQIAFVRNFQGQNEIWYIDFWDKKSNKLSFNDFSIHVYYTVENVWRTIPISVESPLKQIVQIYLDNNGTIWARASQEENTSEIFSFQTRDIYSDGFTKKPFVFTKFVEENNRFEILSFKSKVPLGPVSFDGNKFWIFERDGFLYSLNPNTLEIIDYGDYRQNINNFENQYDIGENIVRYDNQLAFTSNEEFYFTDATPKEYVAPQNRYILHFVPQNREFQTLGIALETTPFLGYLFVDREENLWLSDYALLDTKKYIWNTIIRSPVFITNKKEGIPMLWDYPEIILNSSDGRLWFRSSNGMTWLDVKQEQWCWFTTYQSNIVEDSDRNLWMIADNKLYKLPLSEQ